ncbi:MAG TPA: hypothetical protein VGR28_15365 [Candidatus Thermoplasmatota archaeon]|jgi:hypothetical protein|nr:hypothetical protein [Candidatus Thermoplasmatota archaeon]
MRALALAILLLLPAATVAAEDGALVQLAELLGVAPADLPASMEARTLRVADGDVVEGTRDVPIAEIAAWAEQAGSAPRGPAPALPPALTPSFVGAGLDGAVHRGVSWVGYALLTDVNDCMAPVALVPGFEPVAVPANPATDGPNLYVALEVRLAEAPGAVGSAGMETRVLPTPSAAWSAVDSTDAIFHVLSGDATIVCRDAGWNVISLVSVGGDGTIQGV